MRRIGWVTGVLLVASTVLVGCSKTTVPQDVADVTGLPPISIPDPAISAGALKARGATSAVAELGDVSSKLRARAAKAVAAEYQSVDGRDGQQTTVSGAFFVPRGTPPPGGWPVIAFAHGTLGLSNGCGPSLSADLRGLAPSIASLLDRGYAVTVPDYQGLGRTGVHPYLEPKTVGYNVIDSVRALRSLDPSVSARWLGLGGSQGGQAVWSADELASTYGTGLDLVGALALAPAVDVSRIADLAWQSDLSSDQLYVLPMVVVGVHRVDPALALSDYLSPSVIDKLPALLGCDKEALVSAARSVTAADLVPKSIEAVNALREQLRRMALPQRSLSAPLYVLNGSSDQTVLPAWVAAAVYRSCIQGSRVIHRVIEGADHTNLGPDEAAAKWVAARFAGRDTDEVYCNKGPS